MKYVMLFGSAAGPVELPQDEQQRIMDEINAWWGEHAAAGRILGGERLAAGTTATTIRRAGGAGAPELTDGPFIEAKEEISGFGLIEVDDLDAALALAATWPALQIPGDSVEIRPVYEM